MATPAQVRFVVERLRGLARTAYVAQRITRQQLLAVETFCRQRRAMAELATHLWGPRREVEFPELAGGRLLLHRLRRAGKGHFNLLAFAEADDHRPRRPLRCLVGHRFTREIEASLRWNLRSLFELYGIEEDYSGFDGRAVDIIDDLRAKIQVADFCLFDNRETTNPVKPNVYIEAGMAFAFEKPFIFCHYRGEAWPSDFSNVNYISYRTYEELFERLFAVLPLFIGKHSPR